MDDEKDVSQFDHLYLSRKESIFLKSLIRYSDCVNCPCFYDGCSGNYTRQELATIPNEDFLKKQRPGTTGHVCWKLTNIINMTEFEREQLEKSFDKDFKDNLALLAKSNDNLYVMSSSDFNQTYDQTKQQEDLARASQNQMLDMSMRFQEDMFRAQGVIQAHEAKMSLMEERLKYYETVIRELRQGD